MQERKRKQRQLNRQKNAPKDYYAEAQKYNKKYHDHDKVLNKILDMMFEASHEFAEDTKRPATISDLTHFVTLVHALMWFRANQVETRCVMNEFLLEDTWESLKSVAGRVNAKADIEKVNSMEAKLASMRKDDAQFNEKVERIEPLLESFEQFLADRGLEPKDMFRQRPATLK